MDLIHLLERQRPTVGSNGNGLRKRYSDWKITALATEQGEDASQHPCSSVGLADRSLDVGRLSLIEFQVSVLLHFTPTDKIRKR